MKDILIKVRMEYLFLGLRDIVGIPFNPEDEVKKLNIINGQNILDFGCGIGSYTFPAAIIAGKNGKVYALDKQPIAIKKVKKRLKKYDFHNIVTILSDGNTGLPDESVDMILLFGVLPEIEDKSSLLMELHRVLKPEGSFFSRFCFRIKKEEVLDIIKGSDLFDFTEQNGRILNFSKKRKKYQ